MPSFSALFSPFATSIPCLKVASLYFDEVYLLSPISVIDLDEFKAHHLISNFGVDFRESVWPVEAALKARAAIAAMAWHTDLKPLIDGGIVKVVNPFDEFSMLSLGSQFRALVAAHANKAVQGMFDKARAASEILPVLAHAVVDWRPRRAEPSLTCGQLFEVQESVMRSVMYDAGLVLSKHFGTIPITTGSEEDRLFACHITHSGRQSSQHGTARERVAYEVARHSIIENVPTFDNATASEIVHLRERCREELGAFRIEMKKLATKISDGVVGTDEANAVVEVVSRDVSPIINEMQRKLRLWKAQWAADFLNRLPSFQTVATLASTIFVGLPLGAGLVTAIGVAALQSGLTTHLKTKEVKAGSGLSFLLDVKVAADKAHGER